MLLPTLEWLVALLILETLSEECCLRMRRSAAWVLPFPGESKQGVWALEQSLLFPGMASSDPGNLD